MDSGKVLAVIEMIQDDETLCGDMPHSGSVLVTGGTACTVKVWKRVRNIKNKTEKIQLVGLLYGHSDPVQVRTSLLSTTT